MQNSTSYSSGPASPVLALHQFWQSYRLDWRLPSSLLRRGREESGLMLPAPSSFINRPISTHCLGFVTIMQHVTRMRCTKLQAQKWESMLRRLPRLVSRKVLQETRNCLTHVMDYDGRTKYQHVSTIWLPNVANIFQTNPSDRGGISRQGPTHRREGSERGNLVLLVWPVWFLPFGHHIYI